jgi:polyphosphate kinase 2
MALPLPKLSYCINQNPILMKKHHKAEKGEKHKKDKNNKSENAVELNATETAHQEGKKEKKKKEELDKKTFIKELTRLQIELNKMQEWIKLKGLKLVILFEGRDAAGKGGAIKYITQTLNPRQARVVALGVPTEKEKTQWYFQRYISHLPAAGEMVLFDRSWYNRAGVEHVMGFCNETDYEEFLRSTPEFERILMRSGILLVKYWFSVSDEEQEKRFQARINDPTKHWKISPMDLESRKKWVEYSMAKDKMFAYTDTKDCPWHVVEADDKRRARLNCISHLLSTIPYEEVPYKPIKLPKKEDKIGYIRPPRNTNTYVPAVY